MYEPLLMGPWRLWLVRKVDETGAFSAGTRRRARPVPGHVVMLVTKRAA